MPALLELLAIGVFDTIDAKGKMSCTFLILFVLFCSKSGLMCVVVVFGVTDARV